MCCVTKRCMSVQDTLGAQGVSLLVFGCFGLSCSLSSCLSVCIFLLIFFIIIFESVDLRSFFRPILSN